MTLAYIGLRTLEVLAFRSCMLKHTGFTCTRLSVNQVAPSNANDLGRAFNALTSEFPTSLSAVSYMLPAMTAGDTFYIRQLQFLHVPTWTWFSSHPAPSSVLRFPASAHQSSFRPVPAGSAASDHWRKVQKDQLAHQSRSHTRRG